MSQSPSSPASPKPDIAPVVLEAAPESGLETFLENHLRKILAVLGLGAVGAISWLLVKDFQARSAQKQGVALFQADEPGKLRQVITDFGGTPAAGSAQLLLGHQLAREGKPAEAMEEYKKFLADEPNHPLRDQAALRMALLRLEQGESAGPDGAAAVTEGGKLLDEFLSQYPDSPLVPYATLRKGDVLRRAGDTEAATKLLKDLRGNAKWAGHPYFDKVEERIANAELKAPELVPYVAPPPPEPAAANPLSLPVPGAATSPLAPTLVPAEATPTLLPPAPAPVPVPADPTPAAPAPAAPAN